MKSDPQGSGNLPWVFIALGANIGDARQTILGAIERLEKFSDQPLSCSSFWQTSPVDCPPGSPQFINAVVKFRARSSETPMSLLSKLQGLEKEFGRQTKKILNEPRPLDLDLIAFGNEVCSEPELVLPHPRAHLRRFVLSPLSEIAPHLLLPGQSKTILELLNGLPPGEAVLKLDIRSSDFCSRRRNQ